MMALARQAGQPIRSVRAAWSSCGLLLAGALGVSSSALAGSGVLRLNFEHERLPTAPSIQDWRTRVDIRDTTVRVEARMLTLVSAAQPPLLRHTIRVAAPEYSEVYDVGAGRMTAKRSSAAVTGFGAPPAVAPGGHFFGNELTKRYAQWRVRGPRAGLALPCEEREDVVSGSRVCLGTVGQMPVVVRLRAPLGQYQRLTRLVSVEQLEAVPGGHFTRPSERTPEPQLSARNAPEAPAPGETDNG
jgi:hypothetical protein